MPVRPAVAAVFLLLILCACPPLERQSSFERERKAVQKTWSGVAVLVRTGEVKQNGNAMELSWDYEFGGNKDAAMKAFGSNKPEGYSSTRQTETEIGFARFDGHDSYQLTATFVPAVGSQNTTTVSILLKSFPD